MRVAFMNITLKQLTGLIIMVKYGLTREMLQTYRVAMAYGASFGYCMAQLAQTYRARKAMYGNNE